MQMLLKTGLAILLTIAVFLAPAYFFWYKPKFEIQTTKGPAIFIKRSPQTFARLKAKSELLKNFARKNNYNEEICFLIDMSIESGKKRFFVFDTRKNSVLFAGLVAHGSCNDGFKTEPVFSDKINSGCSCAGKFKIGRPYVGNFGVAYKLYGLDSFNSNAFKRTVVLHSYTCVPEQETDPLPICNSRGCPMVSTGFLGQLKPVINHSKKPVLLWIFD